MFSWKNGTGRFAGHPRKWDGRFEAEPAQVWAAEPPNASTPTEVMAEQSSSSTPRAGPSRMPLEDVAIALTEYFSPHDDMAPKGHVAGSTMANKVCV